MSIEHTCPSCHIRLRLADESAGKKVRCKCGAVSAVPAAVPSPASPTSSPSASPSITLTCTSCQQTLRAPQSAAGKAVRCKCGQIVQVPGAKPAAATAAVAEPKAATSAKSAVPAKPLVAARPTTATATAVAPRPVAPARVASTPASAPVRAAAQPTGTIGSMFDELTDADWNRESPIKRAYAPPAASRDGAVLKKFAGEEVKSTKPGAIPGTLITLSVLNFIGSAFYIFVGVAIILLVQVAAVVEQLEAVFPAITLAASLFCVYFVTWGIYLAVAGVGLLQRAPWGWCVAGVSYAHALIDRIYNVVISFTDGTPPARIVGMIGGMMVIVGITTYIYKPETRQHFKVKSMTPVIICAVIGVSIAIATIIGIELLMRSAESMIPADGDAG